MIRLLLILYVPFAVAVFMVCAVLYWPIALYRRPWGVAVGCYFSSMRNVAGGMLVGGYWLWRGM